MDARFSLTRLISQGIVILVRTTSPSSLNERLDGDDGDIVLTGRRQDGDDGDVVLTSSCIVLTGSFMFPTGFFHGAILLTGNVHSPAPAAPTAAMRNQYRVPLIIVFTVTFVFVGVATLT